MIGRRSGRAILSHLSLISDITIGVNDMALFSAAIWSIVQQNNFSIADFKTYFADIF
jgi:hypothetical protein